MCVHLWEWAVDQGRDGNPAGVSSERHRAMEALAQSLIASRRPARGHVVPVSLVDGVRESFYVSHFPICTADYAEGVIRWH